MAKVALLKARLPVQAGRLATLSNPGSWRAGKDGANARLYTYRWQRASKAFLQAHPLCQCPACDEGRIRVRASAVVHHIEPHRGDVERFWNRDNWQAMSAACHNEHTGRGG